MPVYEEKNKTENGQKRYFIRTYVQDEFGRKVQIKRHNKDWIGRDGYWAAQQEESKLKNKSVGLKKNIYLNELIKDFLDDKKFNIEVSTMHRYETMVRLYIYPFFPENKKICTFTLLDAQNWKKYLDSLDISFTSKKAAYVLMISIFDHANKIANIENPFKRLGNFRKNKSIDNKEMSYLTENEFCEFIKHEEDKIYSIFFKLLFYTGMRKGEALALDWENIDFNRKLINIEKTYNTNYKIVTLPKTEKSKRKILMSDIVYEELTSLYKNGFTGPIFKDYIRATTLREHCGRNLEKAEINKHIRIHDFRHSFASLCINKNIPIYIVSEYLGHKSVNITLEVYSHLYPNSQDHLINIINNQEAKQVQKQVQRIQHPLYLKG